MRLQIMKTKTKQASICSMFSSQLTPHSPNNSFIQLAEIPILQTISQQPMVETLTMYVPFRAVWRIIGRGGESLKEIQRISRSKVDIDRGPWGEGMEKKIVLKVAIDQISMAKQLIEDKVLCCLFLHI